MQEKDSARDVPTREKILSSARKHFSIQGFQAASIRAIASDAGFTPGALYGYFESKEELFYALTDPLIGRITEKLDQIERDMLALPAEKMLMGMGGVFYSRIPELVELIFEDRPIVELVIRGGKGTKYENFMTELVKRDVGAVTRAAEKTEESDLRMPDVQTLEMLMEGYIATLFHMIVSDRDKNEVIRGMEAFGKIYEAGMIELIKKGELFQ